jgi:hypothetical protein
MRNRVLAAALLASSMLAASPAAAVTTFSTNWDSTDFGSGPGFVILPSYEGWTSVAGGGIEVQYNNVAGQPFSGENLVELDSTSNSTMERFIDPGAYLLTFYYSARPNVPANSNGITVFANGGEIYNVTGAGTGATNWMFQQVKFSISAPGSLRFAAVGTSNSLGGYIENISLSGAVPEPATWAMMILGFGAVGGAMRAAQRRKTVLTTA